MERIAHRELRNNSSAILRRVAEGESFEITNHGVVVAVIAAPAAGTGRLEVEREATRRGGWARLAQHRLSRPTREILDELREERL